MKTESCVLPIGMTSCILYSKPFQIAAFILTLKGSLTKKADGVTYIVTLFLTLLV